MPDTIPNDRGQQTPVFPLAAMVEIVTTAAAHGFTLTEDDRHVLEHAGNTFTENGVDDVTLLDSGEVSLPLYIRRLATRALLHHL